MNRRRLSLGQWDRFWMFTIAALSIGVIGAVLVAVILMGKMPDRSDALLGGALTGLVLVARDVVRAVVELVRGGGDTIIDQGNNGEAKVEQRGSEKDVREGA